jgi:acetyl-CoA synthetase
MGQEIKILGEALPFEERIELPSWLSRHIKIESYWEIHRKSLQDYEGFWASVAKELEWFTPFERVVDRGDYPHVYRWFPGGRINVSYLALDRHVRTWRKNKVAYIWEGEPLDEYGVPRDRRKLTYYDLWREVNRVAYILSKNFGLKKGDKIAMYLPMLPELPIFMLAAARLGVIFTQVFAGFTAENLAVRARDLGATVLVTADGFYRRGRIVRLKDIADKAIESVPGIRNVIVVRRLGLRDINMVDGRDFWFDDLLGGVPTNVYIEPERLESDHPLYVLYTSGTTGKPKGIIHDHGGYSVLLHATMKWVFDARDDDIYYCTADIGWVTGHSYIVFGPLIEGLTTVFYEGAPDYPAPDRIWSIVERYGVTILYTTPTLVRMLMRYGDEWVRRHDRSTLRLIHSVGEPINPSAWKWLFEVVGEKRCPVGSTWWMTETGGILISHAPGFGLVPLKPGTNGPPLPGVDADVVDENGMPMEPGRKGYLVIKRPFPGMPAPPTGMWGDPDGYKRIYFEKIAPGKGFFYTGDYAVRDNDGYIWVLGRADEVLKVAGHRIGTYELESVLVSHKSVAEAAVIGIPDPVKGEVPIAYVVLKEDYKPSRELAEELKEWVRSNYGPIAVPSNIFFVTKLPKTRSGKVMRRLVKAVATGSPLGDTTTLEDEAAVEEAKRAYEELLKEIRGQ